MEENTLPIHVPLLDKLSPKIGFWCASIYHEFDVRSLIEKIAILLSNHQYQWLMANLPRGLYSRSRKSTRSTARPRSHSQQDTLTLPCKSHYALNQNTNIRESGANAFKKKPFTEILFIGMASYQNKLKTACWTARNVARTLVCFPDISWWLQDLIELLKKL